MRILVVDPIFSSLPYDQALCAGLISDGHEVKMLGRPLRSDESWNVLNVEHVSLPIVDVIRKVSLSGNILKLYTALRHIRYGLQIQAIERVVRSFKPDVVHFQWCLTPLAEARLIERLRRHATVLLTVHDTTPFNGSQVSSLVTRGLHRLMTRFDHLIVHTQAAAEILAQRGFSRADISVVPHGLLRTQTLSKAAEATGEDGAPVTCLVFGHIKHYKGVDVLIRAVAALPDHVRQRMRFVVAGQLGVDFSELGHLCEQGGVSHLFRFDLRFFPESKIDALMRSADIFVFPYREIQASGVFTLALPYGRPMVASRLGIFGELIEDEVNGLLVPPEDPVALAGALQRLCVDAGLRRAMGEANLSASRAFPSWAEIAGLTTQAYGTALLHGRSGTGSGI